MKLPGLLILGALSFAGAAGAQSLADNPPKVTTLCIDVTGRSLPATCRVPGSRLDSREDICLCGPGAQQVTASVCPAGVKPPAESAAFERARRAAIHGSSLVGATFNGQPMCVQARNQLHQ
ncbi:MAG: hypothetical protein ACJ798_00330 [Phenylobacterium sp.]